MTGDFEKPVAIMMMGRPGAGKDTQAEILAKKMDLIRIVTSDLLQRKFAENPDNPSIKKEKSIFAAGGLNTPSWVLETVKEHVKELSSNNFNGAKGIIFGGSPRTMYEAENLTPFLEELLGRGNIIAFYLEVSEEEGKNRILKRNSRPLDRDPEKIKVRMKEYTERTDLVLNYLEKLGILIRIDGMPPAEDVAAEVEGKLAERISYS
ncbi:MAG: nucleoside monophosphate kinase [Candidatus Spechtbacterales bacterium]